MNLKIVSIWTDEAAIRELLRKKLSPPIPPPGPPTEMYTPVGLLDGKAGVLVWYPGGGYSLYVSNILAADMYADNLSDQLVDLVIKRVREPENVTPNLGQITLRLPMPQKNRYVKAARKQGMGLQEWALQHLDRAAPSE